VAESSRHGLADMVEVAVMKAIVKDHGGIKTIAIKDYVL
jgi:hypothetical protein